MRYRPACIGWCVWGGALFIFQFFEISNARAPPTPPLRRRAGDGGLLNPPSPYVRHYFPPVGNFTAAPESADAPTLCDAPSQEKLHTTEVTNLESHDSGCATKA